MNVLIITQYFYPEVGATSNRMGAFVNAFVQAGHSVTVVTEFPNHPQGKISPQYRGRWMVREDEDGYSVIRMYVSAFQRKTFIKRMGSYVSFMLTSFIGGLRVRPKSDLVIVTSPPLFSAVSGWLVSRLRGAKFVLDVRDLWPAAAVEMGQIRNRAVVGCSRALERFLYRKADLVSTATDGFRQIIDQCDRSASAVVVPNGTDLDLFSPGQGGNSVRKRLGLENKFLATFAGNLGLAQDLDTVLETAALLSEDQRFAFLIIGAGPERDRIENKAGRMKLDNVLFHEQVPVERVPPYLLASDVLLVTLRDLPVFSSFVPSKLFDFMACQKPVISNVQGEARRLVEDSGGGLVVTGGDPEALRDALVNLLADEEACQQMGKNGRSYVVARHDRGQIAASFVNHLHQLWRA